MLKDLFMEDFKNAMKNKDDFAKSVVTMLRSAVKQVEIDTRTELTDAEIIGIIAKQIKQKRGAIEEFANASRLDLVEQTEKEIQFLQKYMPEPLSKEELQQIVSDVISETSASSMKDMGKVVKLVNEKTEGRAESKDIADLVKASLSK